MHKSQTMIESDTLEGTENPKFSRKLVGHTEAWNIFLNCKKDKKIHHAWLLCGPKGIGKATFAWAMAKDLIAENNKKFNKNKTFDMHTLSISTVFVCRRPYDEKTKKLKQFVTIEEISIMSIKGKYCLIRIYLYYNLHYTRYLAKIFINLLHKQIILSNFFFSEKQIQ